MTRLDLLRFLAIASILSFANDAVADGHSITIAGGVPGGSYYDVYASNLKQLLRAYDVRVRSTAGSGENLELLAGGRVELGFAQTDVYADRLLGNPDRYASLKSLGTVAEECVYIAYRKEGPVTSLDQLTGPVGGRDPRLALGPPTSGMQGTWRYMTTMQPGLKAAVVSDEGGVSALEHLRSGDHDAVGWVTDPNNRDHVMLKAVVQSDALALLDLNDASLTRGTLPSSIKVYEHRRVKLEDGWFAPRAKTICTTARLLAGPGASRELVDRVSALLSDEADALTRLPDDR